jgi:hypothetical protein
MIVSSKCSLVSHRVLIVRDGHEHDHEVRARLCLCTNHDHGSSPVTITSFLIHDHEPRTRNTGVMDKTKPHALFLKDNFFSKLPTIRQQSPPESAYANSPKGMRIHREGSFAHAEGWEQSQIPTNSLSGIGISLQCLKFPLSSFSLSPLSFSRRWQLSETRRPRITSNGFPLYPLSFCRYPL